MYKSINKYKKTTNTPHRRSNTHKGQSQSCLWPGIKPVSLETYKSVFPYPLSCVETREMPTITAGNTEKICDARTKYTYTAKTPLKGFAKNCFIKPNTNMFYIFSNSFFINMQHIYCLFYRMLPLQGYQ